MQQYQGPEVVILNELEEAYLPVPFDHKGHAQMAEMADGCVSCHHHTPAGRPHPACRTCHDISGAGTDIAKPCLKGAYHRQCLNCHKDWIDETDCDKCHVRKAAGSKNGGAATSLTKDEMMGRMHPLGQMHPPIPEPDTETYATRSEQAPETQVIFRHREHVERFGLRCVDCHHEESCARCHAREREKKRPRTLAEHHKPCLRCHSGDMAGATGKIAGRCERCHWRKGQPKPPPFDHASTGWPLNRFHMNKSCRVCHKIVPFTKLDRDCDNCHGHWEPGTFDHTVTGQWLDETHAEIDCQDCHPGRKFDPAAGGPTCSECHDEDEGFTFPAKRPGPSFRPRTRSRK